MGARAWNQVFPDPGMRYSAKWMAAGSGPSIFIVNSTMEADAKVTQEAWTTEVAASSHPMLCFSDPLPEQLHFLGSESSLPSPLHPQHLFPHERLPSSPWIWIFYQSYQVSWNKSCHLPGSWMPSHPLNTLPAYCNILDSWLRELGLRKFCPMELHGDHRVFGQDQRSSIFIFSPLPDLVSRFLFISLVHTGDLCSRVCRVLYAGCLASFLFAFGTHTHHSATQWVITAEHQVAS